jgi:HPt (histidine-containing phosphotransfer) domain-containing protein
MTNISNQSADTGATLAAFGIDYTDAMVRMLNNGALFKKLAQHYRDDKNFEALCEDLAAGDFEQAYHHAHTLKGVSGNLSFRQLYKLATRMCEALRNDDTSTAYALLEPMTEAQQLVLQGLDCWQTLD